MKRFRKFGMLTIALTLACLSQSNVRAGEAPKVEAPKINAPKVEAQAEKVLRDLAGAYKNASTFKGQLRLNMKVRGEGMTQDMTTVYSFAFQRPNLLNIHLDQGMPLFRGSVVCDGKRLYAFLPGSASFTSKDAPKSFGGGGAMAMDGLGMAGVALYSDKPYEALLEDVTEVRYIGVEVLDTVRCDHVQTQTKEGSFDLWIQTGEHPLLKKVSIDLSAMFAKQNAAGLKIKSMVMTIDYIGCEVNAAINPAAFKFTPEAGAVEAKGVAAAGPSVLIGKDAPALKLPLLAGGQVDVASQKGKIVVLDFWATWCGPCKRSLPIVSSVAASYQKKGVVFYAVDLGEDSEKVTQFLAAAGLSFPVALDKDGAAAKAYGAESIPLTVIIGKDGKVVTVHVGFSPDMQQQLSKDLHALTEEPAVKK